MRKCRVSCYDNTARSAWTSTRDSWFFFKQSDVIRKIYKTNLFRLITFPPFLNIIEISRYFVITTFKYLFRYAETFNDIIYAGDYERGASNIFIVSKYLLQS